MGNFAYFFPFFFIGMWISTMFILSRFGWAALAKHYQTDKPFIGERAGIISAAINWLNYNNSLILKYNEEGIHLQPVIFFRLFHKPLLIPWKEIKEVQDKKIIIFSFKQLIIGDPVVAKIGLRGNVFSKIENSLNIHRLSNSTPEHQL